MDLCRSRQGCTGRSPWRQRPLADRGAGAGPASHLLHGAAVRQQPFTGVTGIRGDNMTGNYAIPHGGVPRAGCSIASPPAPSSRSPGDRHRQSTSPAPPPTRPMGRASARPAASCAASAATRRRLRPVRPQLSLRRRQRARPADHDAARRPQRLQHDRPLDLRQPARRQLRHRQRRSGQRLPLQHRHRLYDDHQPPGPVHQHHRLRRLRQPHRRRLEPRAGPVARLHPEPEHRRLHRLRRARRGHRGHAFRGHHRRRPRQRPTTWWPIRSTPTAPSAPGSSISTRTAWRPGFRLSVNGNVTSANSIYGRHRDRRLRPERHHQRLHHQCSRHLQPDHQQRRAVDRHRGHDGDRRHRRRRHRQQRHDHDDRRGQRRHQHQHLRRRHQLRHGRRRAAPAARAC